MTQVQSPHNVAKLGHGAVPPDAGTARLLGLGCAVPAEARFASEVAEELADLWSLQGSSRIRWQKIMAGIAIEQRHGVASPRDVIQLSTAERMRLYERHAPSVAAEAARDALETANIDLAHVTDLIVVSCTGFSAPGLDIELVERLGLRRAVRRSMIGFMGCFGAVTGLRSAAAICAADPTAVALVVCCELCSLHLRPNLSMNDQIAAALFSDGAAAALVASNRHKGTSAIKRDASGEMGVLTLGNSLLLSEGREWMTWRLTDSGFAMTLDKAVPSAMRTALPKFMHSAIGGVPQTLAVHPGGPAILAAVDEALELRGGHGISASWEVLRRFGNMSSATVLFVLAELHRTDQLFSPAMLMAFGPGLTIESVGLLGSEDS